MAVKCWRGCMCVHQAETDGNCVLHNVSAVLCHLQVTNNPENDGCINAVLLV